MDDSQITQTVINMLRQRGSFTLGDLRNGTDASNRKVREAIAMLRRRGMLIVCDSEGAYRIAHQAREVFEYTTTLRKQIRSLYATVQAMEESAKRQFHLDLDVKVGCSDDNRR